MFLMLALLLFIGSVSRYYREGRTAEDLDAFTQFDAEFKRLTVRADSVDRAQELATATAAKEAVAKEAAADEAMTRTGPTDSSTTLRLDINRANSEELQTLPRIGPALAKQIIIMRTRFGEFLTVNDLLLVSGIGEKTMEKLRPLVTVIPADSSK